jgi:Fe-S cluster assembly scaffold protein SufB
MKYILNETPLRTTNNYGINNLELDLDIPVFESFREYSFSKELNIKQEVKNNFNSRIGLKHDKYLNVDINIKESTKEPVVIDYDFDKTNGLVSVVDIYLDNVEADLIFRYKSDKDVFNNVKFVISGNGVGNISIVNMLSKDSKSVIAIESLTTNEVTINLIDLGGSIKIDNYYAELSDEGTTNNFNNIYVGNNEDRIDMNYLVKLIGPEAKSNMEVQGALDDKAFKSFKGTLDFVKGAVNSVGKENENCVLLSDSVKSKSLPMMLCHEENVSGAHGVSAGKIDKNKLFYLTSRGLDEDEARRLIINANFAQVINNIPDEEIRHEILKVIEKEVG